MARLGFEPMISRSGVDRENHYSIGHFFEIQSGLVVRNGKK